VSTVTERVFPANASSAKRARTFVAELLSDQEQQVIDAATLMVSELATNAIRHSGSAFRLCVRLTDRQVRIEVTDSGGRGRPTMRRARPTEPSGRGLSIVDRLSSRWGVSEKGPGTTVWFTLVLR
jgi:serine/threonine-protein kinase RsbW